MSRDVAVADFRCVLGAAEFSFGGCDREAFQDILQLLCGLRENNLQGAFVASWKRECAQYELRRVDDGKVDDSGQRGLHVGSGAKSSVGQFCDKGAGLQCGLDGRSDGSTHKESVGHEGRSSDDNAFNGKEFVPQGSQGGSWRGGGVRVGGSAAGAPSLVAGGLPFVTIVRGQDRGPRYDYNRAQRERKKALAAKRRESASYTFGKAGRTEEEQQLHELRVKRQIIQERKKLDRLTSPQAVVQDQLEKIRFADKCAQVVGNAHVSKWAAGVSTESTESIIKSVGGSVVRDAERVAGSARVPGETGRTEKKKKKEVSFSSVSGLSTGGSVPTRSARSDGVLYTKETAARWLSRYTILERCKNDGYEPRELAQLASVSVDEVNKFFRLKREFGL